MPKHLLRTTVTMLLVSLMVQKSLHADDQWYTVTSAGECRPDGPPADILVMWQNMGLPYTTEDVQDPATGRIVQTTLHMTDNTLPIPNDRKNFTMYRGFDRCRAAISAARDLLYRQNGQVWQKYQ